MKRLPQNDNVKLIVNARKANVVRVLRRLLLKLLKLTANARSAKKGRRRRRRKRRERSRLKRTESAVRPQRGHRERGYLYGLLLDRVFIAFAFGFNDAATYCLSISSSAASSKPSRSDSKATDDKVTSPSKSRADGKARA